MPVINTFGAASGRGYGLCGRPYGPSGSKTYSTPGTYSFTLPAYVTSITIVEITAGGGGGAAQWFNGSDQFYSGGAGGSGGYRTSGTLAVAPGETLSIVVGAGGGAGTYPGAQNQPTPSTTQGYKGGDSSITSSKDTVSCTGGGGGYSAGASAPYQGFGAGGSPNGTNGSGAVQNGAGVAGPTNPTGHGAGGNSQGNGGTSISAGGNGYVSFSWAGVS